MIVRIYDIAFLMTNPKVAMIVKLTYSCTPLRYSYRPGNLITLIENKRYINPVIGKKVKNIT